MKLESHPQHSVFALVRPAVVMKPPEVREQAAEMRQDASIMHGHAFRLQLPEAVVTALERTDAPRAAMLAVLLSPKGVAVVCVTLQVGGLQMRTVCNGNDACARGWLSDVLERAQVNWFLDIEGTQQVAWVSTSVQLTDTYKFLMALHESAHLAVADEAIEVATVGVSLALPEAVPSLIEGVDIDTLVIAAQPQTRGHAAGRKTQDIQTIH